MSEEQPYNEEQDRLAGARCLTTALVLGIASSVWFFVGVGVGLWLSK